MRCSFTSIILMPIMRQILIFKNTSSFLGWICKAPRSHIPIGVGLWGWREKWGTCCGCWCWLLSRFFGWIPLMHLLMLGMNRFCNCFWESNIFISPSTWSAWRRCQIIPSLWWSLFLCTCFLLDIFNIHILELILWNVNMHWRGWIFIWIPPSFYNRFIDLVINFF